MPLPVYFAPLEGVTDSAYRRVHHEHFSGIKRYYIPFISPTQTLTLTTRELSNVSPEYNTGVPVVPQVLTRNAEHFIWAAQQLYDMGHEEVNLNTGCPSGTVTAKGKGAGMLAHVPELEIFLDEIFAHTPMRISIKTRVGYTSPDEFPRLLELFSRYPVKELIIHPRTREQFYKGTPHRDTYAQALGQTRFPIVYNGDLFTAAACRDFERDYPGTSALMLGRGLLANPALAQQYAGGEMLTKESLRAFHDDLLREYLERYPKNVVVARLREVMKNIACSFDGSIKPLKAVRKAANLAQYEDAVNRLFGECELSAVPQFNPNL